jgi:hypothetical protein
VSRLVLRVLPDYRCGRVDLLHGSARFMSVFSQLAIV